MRVHIVGGGKQYADLFTSLGHELDDEWRSDLIVFTGGSDVNPMLYGQTTHPYTQSSINRDEDDIKAYLRNLYKPKVGICRGAQFLHVMNGGRLYQDVDNHAVQGTHKLVCKASGQEWDVTSTHHQMMAPGVGVVVGVANQTTYVDSHIKYENVREQIPQDIEVVMHPKALCFQPHPEFYGADSTKECFNHFLTIFLEEYHAN